MTDTYILPTHPDLNAFQSFCKLAVMMGIQVEVLHDRTLVRVGERVYELREAGGNRPPVTVVPPEPDEYILVPSDDAHSRVVMEAVRSSRGGSGYGGYGEAG